MSEEIASSQAENPYAVPEAELQPQAQQGLQQSGAYYAMSSRKVVLMSCFTLGIYDLWFWWRHWRIQQQRGRDLSVFWRTFFAGFYCFDFKNGLAFALATRDRTPHSLLTMAPLVYLVCNVAQHIIWRIGGDSAGVLALDFTLIVVRAFTLSIFQKDANQVLDADGYRGKVNRGASTGIYVVGALGLLFWALVLFGSLMPDAPQ